MAVAIYGNISLGSIDASEVDILYAFSPDRTTIGDVQMQPLFNNPTDSDLHKLLGVDGVFKLRLPAETFNQLGFYSILIQPKKIQTTLLDCSFVVTNDTNEATISKRGLVLPAAQFQKTGSLVGFQIEYFDKNNVKIQNLSRIITSADLVSISTNNNSVAQGSTNYVLDPNGSSLFITVSPDEPSLISNNTPVDIGSKGQNVLISSTYFNPVFLEVEMVDTTLQTIGYFLGGNSTRDLETGLLTYFDNQNNVYRQYNLYTRKKQFITGNIDVKEQRAIINTTSDFNSISQGITTS